MTEGPLSSVEFCLIIRLLLPKNLTTLHKNNGMRYMHCVSLAGAGPSEALEEQLTDACREGQAELARQLLDQGAEPGFQDAEGVTPLMLAAESGNAALVSALLGKG